MRFFLASLQIENAHLKQTYKDLFESIQSSGRNETNQCDDVKHKFDFDEIETQNIELEHQVASLVKENEHLNLYDSDPFTVESESGEKNILFGNETSSFETKLKELEMTLAQQTKDFEDAKDDFSKKTDKFKTYFEKLKNRKVILELQLDRKIQDSKAEKEQFLKQIVSLESNLASQDLISNQKEYSDLRTSYNALKEKFDSLNRDKGKSLVSNFSTLK
ncbi:hypothetical protein Tco_0061514, partial [Tanacetum coccineum]